MPLHISAMMCVFNVAPSLTKSPTRRTTGAPVCIGTPLAWRAGRRWPGACGL